MKRVALLISCLAIAFVLTACQRLETVRPLESRGRGELRKERLPFKDALPADFGDLVAVTGIGNHPTWSQAWFVRPDKSIAVVWINSETGDMLEEAVIIPRR